MGNEDAPTSSSGMFKNFDPETDRSSSSLAKSSVQRGIIQKIEAQYPLLPKEVLEHVLPKKQAVTLLKCKDHVTLIMSPVLNEPVFFQVRDGPYFPTLKFLHRAGDFMPKLQVDAGGIKFVLRGADIFSAGLVSEGGKLFQELEKDVPVQIMGEGKELPFAVGVTAQTTEEMRLASGVGVTQMHFLNDDLWKVSKWRI